MGQAGAGEYAAVGDNEEDTTTYSKLLAKKYEDGKLSAEEEAELERVMNGSTGIRDGELGAHIGFAPTFKTGGSLDLEKNRSSNVKYAGAGEMGLIMLDFQWNAMMNSKGYSELAKSMYDQKMWAAEGAPTLRTVTAIAASIVARLSGFKWIEYVDDAIFAGLDLSQGYKSVGEVGLDLAVSVGTSLIPGGSSIGGVQGALINAGIAAAKSYSVSVTTNYLSAVNFENMGTDDWIDRNKLREANKSWYSAKTIAGAIGAGVAAGAGTMLGDLNAAGSKFLSGSIKLGTAFAVEAAKYSVYAGYSLASEDWSGGNVFGHIGNALGNAYDDMGGLTVNVANLGAILDFAGSVMARGNNDGQSIFGDGSILQSLSGIGLLEVNFGRDGISTAIGMGGIDVGGALYEQIKRGIDYAGLKSYAKEEQNSWKADMAWDTYVYGDFTQENTAMRIVNGKDYLDFTDKGFGVDENGRIRFGETVSGGRDGKGRTITITDIGDLDTMSVVLGHEAYRDGKTGADNKQETREAVIAHTKMADRMKAEGSDFSGSFVGLDLAVYDYARSVGNMGIMDAYADMVYRSDGDYFDIDTVLGGKKDYVKGAMLKDIGMEILNLMLIAQGTFDQLFGEHFMRTGVEYNNTPDASSNNAERVLGLWNEIEKKGKDKSEIIKEVATESDLVKLFNSMADGGILEPVKFDWDVKEYMRRTTAVLSDGTKISYRLESSASSGNLPTIDIIWPKSWGMENYKIHITYPTEDEKK
jgi:hypothetical protein